MNRSVMLVLAMLAATPTAQAQSLFGEPKKIEDAVIAVVNRQAVTRYELIQRCRLKRIYRELERRNDAESVKARLTLEQRKLMQLIEEKLIAQEAKKLKIKLDKDDEKEVKRKIEQLAEPFNGLTGFKNKMAERGISYKVVEQEIRANILTGRVYFSAITKNIFVSPSAIRDYYRENPKEFKRPATTRVRRIALTLKKYALTEAGEKWLKERKMELDSQSCRKLGEFIRERILKHNDDAGRLAGKYSMRLSEQERNGLFEAKSEGEKYAKVKGVRGLAEISARLKEGEVSKLVERRKGGYDIVYLELRRPRSKERFETAQDNIVRKLKEREWKLQVNQWMGALRKKATIVFYNP